MSRQFEGIYCKENIQIPTQKVKIYLILFLLDDFVTMKADRNNYSRNNKNL